MGNVLKIGLVAVSTAVLAACGGGGGGADSRDSVSIVGSSTVYPFSAAVAEQTAKDHEGIKTPKVESTGSGAGMKLFCSGLGAGTPDVSNASRQIKLSEFEDCQANGVTDVIEVQVGLDGIAFAQSKDGLDIELTPQDVYKALAANPYGKPQTAKNWSDINPAFPNEPISVYGPPTTSGTRDALAELILEAGCKADPAMAELKKSDEDKYDAVCTEVREDGGYIDGGEKDNLIVKKIADNPKTIGVFGFSFLEENMDTLRGIKMGGVEPTYANISDFSYPGARPLYMYVKKAHLDVIPGLKEYLNTWPTVWGMDGLLKTKGMVVSPEQTRKDYAERIANLVVVKAEDLK